MTDGCRIQFFKTLNGIAAELAVRGWLDGVENGFSDGELNMSAEWEALVGFAPNGRDVLPVGVMTFKSIGAYTWVYQSYVVPEFRGRGVYSGMWSSLVGYVAENHPNSLTIESSTHVRNQVMRGIAKKQGRVEESVVLKFVIPR